MITKEYLIQEWIVNKKSQREIADKLNVTLGKIEYLIKKYSLIRKRTKSKFELNIDKITINNPEFCYFCGLVATDGYIDSKNNRVCLLMKNKGISEIFKSIIDYFEYNGNYYVNNSIHALRITSKRLVTYLVDIGITDTNKTFNLMFPTLIQNHENKECIKMFLRGCIDGDGNIRKNKGFRICTASLCFIQGFIEVINRLYTTNYKITYQDKKYPKLEISSKKGTEIVKNLYADYPNFRLQEKWLNIDNDIVQI